MARELVFMTAAELDALGEAERKRRRKRNPPSKAGLTLTGGGYEYFIHRERIDTPGKVLHWLAHLSDKTWITRDDLGDVVSYAWRYNNVNPYAEHA